MTDDNPPALTRSTFAADAACLVWFWPEPRRTKGSTLSSTSMRMERRPGWTAARTMKVPPERRESLCRALLAASSEAQTITSSAGQPCSSPCRSARTALTCSTPPG